MMSKNYKIVSVSSMSGERLIEEIELLKASSLEKAIELTKEFQIAELQKELNIDIDDWTEEDERCYSESVIHETETGVAFLECGDRQIKVIIEETNEWYQQLTKHKQWDGAIWAEWDDVLNSFW